MNSENLRSIEPNQAPISIQKIESLNRNPDNINLQNIYKNFSLEEKKSTVLIATAIIFVQDKFKNWKICRTVLDSASQSNFITEKLRKSLHISKQLTSIKISGFNQHETIISGKIKTKIKSRSTNYIENLEFLVTSQITNEIPESDFYSENIKDLQIELADPQFNIKRKIDMLLGAEIFFDVLEQGKLKATESLPLFIETKFGWIASGKINSEKVTSESKQTFLANSLDEELQKMWALEKCDYKKELLTTEEKLCEQHFVVNTTRDELGRFIVKYPLKQNKNQLGDSYWISFKRIQYLQKKFQRLPEIKKTIY